MYYEYEDDQEYEAAMDDRLYDEMRDDFLCIENKEDAKSCIRRYPNQVDRFLPEQYKYLWRATMFTLEDLQELKRLSRITIDQEYAIVKKMEEYGVLANCSLEGYIYYNPTKLGNLQNVDDDVTKQLQDIIDKAQGAKITIRGITRESGRYDFFDYVSFRAEVPSIYSDDGLNLEGKVRRLTKQKLNKMFRPSDYPDWMSFDIDCKLMDQFKAGHLTMEQVIEGTLKDCEV